MKDKQFYALSRREPAVFLLLAEGEANKEIAIKLRIGHGRSGRIGRR